MSIQLLDNRTDRYVDALYAVLVSTDELSFFPELYEIFGRETVVKFLDIFAGQTIKVPTREHLESKIRDVIIWIELKKGKPRNHLMDEFNISLIDLERIYSYIDDSLAKLGIVVAEDSTPVCTRSDDNL